MKNTEIMINLNHPCREVDIWEVENQKDFIAAVGQGYMPLNVVRMAIKMTFPHLDRDTQEYLENMKEHNTVSNE